MNQLFCGLKRDSCRLMICIYLSGAFIFGQPLYAQTPPRGTLFIIGGGDISDTLRREMLSVAGWKAGDYVAAVTLASRWDSSYYSINEAFQKFTGVPCIRVDSMTIHQAATLDSLRKARLIYLGGGDQALFMQHIAGTPVRAILQQAYRSGATIAGTSAGASVMSRMMVTGNSNRDSVSSTALKGIWSGSVEYAEGLCLLDSVIIDQHFVVRSRYNRLLASMMDYPRYQGVGINESTAIIVRGREARVTGASQVVVLEKPERVRRLPDGNLGAHQIRLSVYLPGDRFRIKL